MGNESINQNFKIKCGTVETVEGLVPEAGAIIYDRSLQLVLVGDGFKWVSISANTGNNASLSLQQVTPVDIVLVANTPKTPIAFADTVVDQVLALITATLPDTVTITDDMDVDIQANFELLTDTPNVTLITRTLINGAKAKEVTRSLTKGVTQSFSSTARYTVTNPSIFTIEMEANRNCTVRLQANALGFAQV